MLRHDPCPVPEKTQSEDRRSMKRSNARWAAVFLICLALVVVPKANAAHRFARILPKDPNAEAKIASRATEGARLHKGEKGDWRFKKSVTTERSMFSGGPRASTRSGT